MTQRSVQTSESDLDRQWNQVIRRRGFLQGIGAAGAATVAPAFAQDHSRLGRGDIALLQVALMIETIEADLWQQYNELGGAVDTNDKPIIGNPAYKAALSNIDEDMPQYISDNTDDELSHAAFLAAYLRSKGVSPVNLSPFATLTGSTATGSNRTGRLTNLLSLNVDTSWYFRYRSTRNPDLGTTFPQLVDIKNQPVIPVSDNDTDPNLTISIPPVAPGPNRMQAIANSAAFHFAAIEQGGSSLYPILVLKAANKEVQRILLSIGGVEVNHFSLWHDKAGNAIADSLAGVSDPTTGLIFPDFNDPANQHNAGLSAADQAAGSQMFQTNLILAEPCQFLNAALPPVSIIRPTLMQNGGALATIQSFTASNLFLHQSKAFFDLLMEVAAEADAIEMVDAQDHSNSKVAARLQSRTVTL